MERLFLQKKSFLAGAVLALWVITGVPVASAADELQLIINNQLYLQTEQQAGPQLV